MNERYVDIRLSEEQAKKLVGPWYLIKQRMASDIRSACKRAIEESTTDDHDVSVE